MKTFKDLIFIDHDSMPGVMSRMQFDNGYGVSVIKGDYSYGGPNLYELAVLKDDQITYDSPVTYDVIGYLEPEDITEYMKQIQKPKYGKKSLLEIFKLWINKLINYGHRI